MADMTFFEILFQSAEFQFDGRDVVEDALEEALESEDLGEVSGGGSGMGITNIDVEVTDAIRGLSVIRKVLHDLGVARSTVIAQYQPDKVHHRVYED